MPGLEITDEQIARVAQGMPDATDQEIAEAIRQLSSGQEFSGPPEPTIANGGLVGPPTDPFVGPRLPEDRPLTDKLGRFVQVFSGSGPDTSPGDVISNLGSDIYDNAKNTVNGLYQTVRHPINTFLSIKDSIANSSLSDTIQNVGGVASRLNPFFWATGPAYDAVSDWAKGNLKPVEAYAQEARKEATGGLPLVAGAKAIKGIADVASEIKLPRANMAQEEFARSKVPGVTANILNVGKRNTDAEGQLASDLARYENNFIQRGVTAGLDSNDPSAMQQVGQRLSNLVTQGSETKAQIIASVPAEAPGVTWQSVLATRLPQGKQTLGQALGDMPDAVRADVSAVIEDVRLSFMTPRTMLDGVMTEADQGLHASDVSRVIKNVDAKITELRGYDDRTLATMGKNPSVAAKELSALRMVRAALSSALEDSVANTLGQDAATALRQANLDIGTGIEYGGQVKRFVQETGQGYTPGSASSLNKNVNPDVPLSKGGWLSAAQRGVNNLIYGPEDAQTLAATNARNGEAISSLQNVADYRSGKLPPPNVDNRPLPMVQGLTGVAGNTIGALGSPTAQLFSHGLPGQQNPFPQGLPRETKDVEPISFISHFLQQTGGSPVATELAKLFSKGLAEGDRNKVEGAHEAMTMAFPNLFVRGYGVGGKIRNVSLQQQYMLRLANLQSEGRLKDITLIAKQQSNFNDPGNLKIIPPDPFLDSDPRVQLEAVKQKNKVRIESADGTYEYNQ